MSIPSRADDLPRSERDRIPCAAHCKGLGSPVYTLAVRDTGLCHAGACMADNEEVGKWDSIERLKDLRGYSGQNSHCSARLDGLLLVLLDLLEETWTDLLVGPCFLRRSGLRLDGNAGCRLDKQRCVERCCTRETFLSEQKVDSSCTRSWASRPGCT